MIMLSVVAFSLTPEIWTMLLLLTALHLTLHGDSWPFHLNSLTPALTQVVRRATVERAQVKPEQGAFKGQMAGRTAPLDNLRPVAQGLCVCYI